MDRTHRHVLDLAGESWIRAASLSQPRHRGWGALALGAAAQCGRDHLNKAWIGCGLRIDQDERPSRGRERAAARSTGRRRDDVGRTEVCREGSAAGVFDRQREGSCAPQGWVCRIGLPRLILVRPLAEGLSGGKLIVNRARSRTWRVIASKTPRAAAQLAPALPRSARASPRAASARRRTRSKAWICAEIITSRGSPPRSSSVRPAARPGVTLRWYRGCHGRARSHRRSRARARGTYRI